MVGGNLHALGVGQLQRESKLLAVDGQRLHRLVGQQQLQRVVALVLGRLLIVLGVLLGGGSVSAATAASSTAAAGDLVQRIGLGGDPDVAGRVAHLNHALGQRRLLSHSVNVALRAVPFDPRAAAVQRKRLHAGDRVRRVDAQRVADRFVRHRRHLGRGGVDLHGVALGGGHNVALLVEDGEAHGVHALGLGNVGVLGQHEDALVVDHHGVRPVLFLGNARQRELRLLGVPFAGAEIAHVHSQLHVLGLFRGLRFVGNLQHLKPQVGGLVVLRLFKFFPVQLFGHFLAQRGILSIGRHAILAVHEQLLVGLEDQLGQMLQRSLLHLHRVRQPQEDFRVFRSIGDHIGELAVDRALLAGHPRLGLRGNLRVRLHKGQPLGQRRGGGLSGGRVRGVHARLVRWVCVRLFRRIRARLLRRIGARRFGRIARGLRRRFCARLHRGLLRLHRRFALLRFRGHRLHHHRLGGRRFSGQCGGLEQQSKHDGHGQYSLHKGVPSFLRGFRRTL